MIRFDNVRDKQKWCRVFQWKPGKIDGDSGEPGAEVTQIPVLASSASRATLSPQFTIPRVAIKGSLFSGGREWFSTKLREGILSRNEIEGKEER